MSVPGVLVCVGPQPGLRGAGVRGLVLSAEQLRAAAAVSAQSRKTKH